MYLLISLIRNFLEGLPKDDEQFIIHRSARGADSIAGAIAYSLGMNVKFFPAKWETYGKRAGILRNTQMLKEGKPDIVVYYHKNLEHSKGTKNMVEQAINASIPVMNGITEEWIPVKC